MNPKTYWQYSHIQETICEINVYEKKWKAFKMLYLVYKTNVTVLIENVYNLAVILKHIEWGSEVGRVTTVSNRHMEYY